MEEYEGIAILATNVKHHIDEALIDVSYRVRATNSQHNLVYPFYLQEGSAQ